jgi:hypothetical protein
MDRALELGADELMNRIEFTLSNRPRALHSARKIYHRACKKLSALSNGTTASKRKW